MTRFAILALLVPLPAFAQSVDQTPPAASQTPPAATSSRLPLAAMRHEQPRQNQVNQRELETFGPGDSQAQKQRQNEVDQLYGEIMRQSAPPQGQR